MKRISRLIIGLGVLICGSLSAQTLNGVVESIKGQPISHAQISLRHNDVTIQTQTDKQGKFLFHEVESGKYFFSAAKNHMLTFDQQVIVDETPKRSMKIKLIPIEFAVFQI